MTKKIAGILAGCTLLCSGVSLAQGSPGTSSGVTRTQGDTGSVARDKTYASDRSGDAMGNQSAMEKKAKQMTQDTPAAQASAPSPDAAMASSTDTANRELTGKVVKIDGNKMVWVRHMGAVVPLKIDGQTRFPDASVKKAKDLKEGQEIRASFLIKDKTNNIARTITPSEGGTGGSGSSTYDPYIEDGINGPSTRGTLDPLAPDTDFRDSRLHPTRPLGAYESGAGRGSNSSGTLDHSASDSVDSAAKP